MSSGAALCGAVRVVVWPNLITHRSPAIHSPAPIFGISVCFLFPLVGIKADGGTC
jgi:hypothetical protein